MKLGFTIFYFYIFSRGLTSAKNITKIIRYSLLDIHISFDFRSNVDDKHFCWIGVINPKPFVLPVSATRTIRLYAAVASQGCFKTTAKLGILARPYPPAQHAFLTQIVSSSSLLVIKDPKSEVTS